MDPTHGRAAAVAAWTLAVDAVTAEVSAAFSEAGLNHLLIKGPATVSVLASIQPARSYGDTDLLVAPADQAGAERTLAQLGFSREWGPLEHAGMASPPANPWTRHGMSVDLHVRVPGIGLEPSRAFAHLLAEATTLEVGGRPVRVPAVGARLTQLALHAWHHGPNEVGPLSDLVAAVEGLPLARWRQAADAARGLEAAGPFAVGLSLVDGGPVLLEALRLRARPSVSWLLATGDVPMAAGIDRLATTPGFAARIALLRDEAFPSVAFMRWSSALARRSRRGLVAAYCVRLGQLVQHAVPAVRAWRRARRSADA